MKTLGQAYGDLLCRFANEYPQIFTIEADLLHGTENFKSRFPERSLDVGVAEANMAGVAAGLAILGKKPFIHSFSPFVSRRIFDQIYISVAYARLPIVIVGSSPGITAGVNGGTHMSFEDFAMFRCVPEMVVFEPADWRTLECAFERIITTDKPVYMRLNGREEREILPEGAAVEIGRAVRLHEGSDVSIIAAGFLAHEGIEAVRALREIGVSADLIYVHTVKPLDKEMIIDSAAKTGAVVVAENHSEYNGLGDAVLDALRDSRPVYLEKVAIRDCFGEVGSVEYLQKKFGLTAKNIIDAALTAMKGRR